jgi:hypothetical protein
MGKDEGYGLRNPAPAVEIGYILGVCLKQAARSFCINHIRHKVKKIPSTAFLDNSVKLNQGRCTVSYSGEQHWPWPRANRKQKIRGNLSHLAHTKSNRTLAQCFLNWNTLDFSSSVFAFGLLLGFWLPWSEQFSWVTYSSVRQQTMNRCFSNCGPRRPAGGFGTNSNAKIVSGTEQMKNTPIYVCAKTTFVGWPSTESTRISSFHNFLSFNHYFRKYFTT